MKGSGVKLHFLGYSAHQYLGPGAKARSAQYIWDSRLVSVVQGGRFPTAGRENETLAKVQELQIECKESAQLIGPRKEQGNAVVLNFMRSKGPFRVWLEIKPTPKKMFTQRIFKPYLHGYEEKQVEFNQTTGYWAMA